MALKINAVIIILKLSSNDDKNDVWKNSEFWSFTGPSFYIQIFKYSQVWKHKCALLNDIGMHLDNRGVCLPRNFIKWSLEY